VIGVVIGHFNCINFLELSLKLLAIHEPNVKILVSDDGSRNPTYDIFGDNVGEKIKKICSEYENVTLDVNEKMLGHSKGDFEHLKKGLKWAKDNNLTYLCKLSQRCVINEKGLLTKFVSEMIRQKIGAYRYKSRLHSFFLLMQVDNFDSIIGEELINIKGINVEEKIALFIDRHEINVKYTTNKNILHRSISKSEDYENIIKQHNFIMEYNYPFYIHAPCKTFKQINEKKK
jgi:hypothetical protein